MDYRLITKYFACDNCNEHFKKLVPSNTDSTECRKCGSNEAKNIEPNEFNREALDRTYRLNTLEDPLAAKEHHLRTNVFDRDISNVHGDAGQRQRDQARPVNTGANTSPTGTGQSQTHFQPGQRSRQQNSQRTQSNQQGTDNTNRRNVYRPFGMDVLDNSMGPRFAPFNLRISPFFGSVNRHTNNNVIFNDLFGSFFNIPNQDFFDDNFSSNFASNFTDPMMRIVFVQSMNNDSNRPTGNPPAAKTAVKNLKHFKMTEEYCKKDEKEVFEYPSCSVCLTEIAKDCDTVLVPCGHMFHSPCILKWLELHNTCPVCRYELPTEDQDYERQRTVRDGGTEREPRRPTRQGSNTNNINSNNPNVFFTNHIPTNH